MLPANRLLATFTALLNLVSIHLRLFVALSVDQPMYGCMRMEQFRALLPGAKVDYTHCKFAPKSNKEEKCSLVFPLKNVVPKFYIDFTNAYVIVDKREGVVSTLWVPMVLYV